MDVRHYTIDLDLDIPGQSVTGSTTILCNLHEPATGILFDLMDSFLVKRVWVNEKPASFYTRKSSASYYQRHCLASGRYE